MKDESILKDILQTRISNQAYYNENLISHRNPEIRQVFTQMRDDETRSIIKLQKRIKRLESAPSVISTILPSKPKF